MSKIAVIYWSGTGCTEAMAEKVCEGAKKAGAEVSIFNVSNFDSSLAGSYDAFAFGCPAMGAEQLEDSEFEPVFNECANAINGKKTGLFGSYGWGNGEWMREWEQDCRNKGAVLVSEGVICCGSPDYDASVACENLGKLLS